MGKVRLQKDGFSCGPTCFAILCDHWRVRRAAPPADPEDGIHPTRLWAALKSAGFKCVGGRADLAALGAMVRGIGPAICLVDLNGEGHWVVVTNVTRTRVHVHCPVKGLYSQPRDAFEARWLDADSLGQSFPNFCLVPFRPVANRAGGV